MQKKHFITGFIHSSRRELKSGAAARACRFVDCAQHLHSRNSARRRGNRKAPPLCSCRSPAARAKQRLRKDFRAACAEHHRDREYSQSQRASAGRVCRKHSWNCDHAVQGQTRIARSDSARLRVQPWPNRSNAGSSRRARPNEGGAQRASAELKWNHQ